MKFKYLNLGETFEWYKESANETFKGIKILGCFMDNEWVNSVCWGYTPYGNVYIYPYYIPDEDEVEVL